MNKPFATLSAALLLLFAATLPAQKKTAPRPSNSPARAIRFQGAPQYTEQELLAAADLKPQTPLDASGIKAHAKRLNETGLFDAIKFSSDSKGVLYTLTPTGQLFPLRLENLPLEPGKALDERLHSSFPLYRGQLPASGAMVEGICATLEQLLAAAGVKATVKATLTSGLGPQKITAMNFSIASLPVKIGPIQLAGVSAAMQAKARQVALGQSGNDYDTTNSAPGLKRAFEDFYQEQSYPAVQVQVAQTAPLVSEQAIAIPFTVTIAEGGVYKLGSISYPADALVTRAEVEKVLAKFQPGSGRPLDLFVLAVRDAHHAKGYLDSATVTHTSFNESTRIVNYSLEVTPGALYRLAAAKFDGAPDAMAVKLKKVWKMMPGAAFDESFVSNFAALAQKQDKQLGKWMQTMLVTFDVQTDAGTHTVNCVFHFAKAVQGGK